MKEMFVMELSCPFKRNTSFKNEKKGSHILNCALKFHLVLKVKFLLIVIVLGGLNVQIIYVNLLLFFLSV